MVGDAAGPDGFLSTQGFGERAGTFGIVLTEVHRGRRGRCVAQIVAQGREHGTAGERMAGAGVSNPMRSRAARLFCKDRISPRRIWSAFGEKPHYAPQACTGHAVSVVVAETGEDRLVRISARSRCGSTPFEPYQSGASPACRLHRSVGGTVRHGHRTEYRPIRHRRAHVLTTPSHHRNRGIEIALTTRNEPPSSRALVLQQELARVRPALDAFARAAFGPNVYQETPYLRGLLFSSGCQTGGAQSQTLPDWLDVTPARAPGNSGLFLRDVFTRVLPPDREPSRPVERPSRSRLALRRLTLAGWLVTCVAVGLMMTASFVDDVRTVELIRRDYPAHPRFTGELTRDVATLERIGRAIVGVERCDERRLVRTISDATPVGRLEAELKRRYVAHYRRSIEPSADRLFFDETDRTSDAQTANDSDVAVRIRNLVRYINLMQARRRGADRETLARMPAPTAVRTLDDDGLSLRIDALTVDRIAWSAPNDHALTGRIASAQAQLEQLAYRDPDGSWLLVAARAARRVDGAQPDAHRLLARHRPARTAPHAARRARSRRADGRTSSRDRRVPRRNGAGGREPA